MSGPHPAPEVLALAARGDLPLLTKLRLRSHLMRCAACGHLMEQFAAAAAELRREASTETLTAFEAIADWNRLEREMLGNIVVGVSAARCIEKVGRKRRWLSTATIVTALVALFVGGWMTHIPSEETHHLVSKLSDFAGLRPAPRPANMVRTTRTGIAVRSHGVTLTILHPPSAVVSVSGNSSVAARYVDEDTGQVTITSVYGQ